MPYNDVRIHISAEALTRAMSVFEGVKGYWNDTGEIFAVRTPAGITTGSVDLLRCCTFQSPSATRILDWPGNFGRPVAGSRSGSLVPRDALRHAGALGEGTFADLIVTAFTQQKHNPDPMRLGVSTWRRATDVSLPTRVKSSANYVGGRLARIEVRRSATTTR